MDRPKPIWPLNCWGHKTNTHQTITYRSFDENMFINDLREAFFEVGGIKSVYSLFPLLLKKFVDQVIHKTSSDLELKCLLVFFLRVTRYKSLTIKQSLKLGFGFIILNYHMAMHNDIPSLPSRMFICSFSCLCNQRQLSFKLWGTFSRDVENPGKCHRDCQNDFHYKNKQILNLYKIKMKREFLPQCSWILGQIFLSIYCRPKSVWSGSILHVFATLHVSESFGHISL